MGTSLVIVESPAKAKTLEKYLGKQFRVEATKGHVRDLPPKKLGVDLSNNFAPDYVVMPDRSKIVDKLKKIADKAENIYLAPDPDREGEAIAWHIAQALGKEEVCMRATFNEVTKKAVKNAVENPGKLNRHLVDAQQARRILDRLVGYQISPLLGRQLKWGLSAGRVQSVAVRMVVEREREIRAFKPEEFWNIEADASAAKPPPFKMKLSGINGKKPKISNHETAHGIVDAIKDKPFHVTNVEKKKVYRKPSPPFITSTLQQEAARKNRMTASQTMRLAQQLYEGVEVGAEGRVGLITYMRTDSTRLSNEALSAIRDHIDAAYGPDYLPDSPVRYQSKKNCTRSS